MSRKAAWHGQDTAPFAAVHAVMGPLSPRRAELC
jgi:hypothetical protein